MQARCNNAASAVQQNQKPPYVPVWPICASARPSKPRMTAQAPHTKHAALNSSGAAAGSPAAYTATPVSAAVATAAKPAPLSGLSDFEQDSAATASAAVPSSSSNNSTIHRRGQRQSERRHAMTFASVLGLHPSPAPDVDMSPHGSDHHAHEQQHQAERPLSSTQHSLLQHQQQQQRDARCSSWQQGPVAGADQQYVQQLTPPHCAQDQQQHHQQQLQRQQGSTVPQQQQLQWQQGSTVPQQQQLQWQQGSVLDWDHVKQQSDTQQQQLQQLRPLRQPLVQGHIQQEWLDYPQNHSQSPPFSSDLGDQKSDQNTVTGCVSNQAPHTQQQQQQLLLSVEQQGTVFTGGGPAIPGGVGDLQHSSSSRDVLWQQQRQQLLWTGSLPQQLRHPHVLKHWQHQQQHLEVASKQQLLQQSDVDQEQHGDGTQQQRQQLGDWLPVAASWPLLQEEAHHHDQQRQHKEHSEHEQPHWEEEEEEMADAQHAMGPQPNPLVASYDLLQQQQQQQWDEQQPQYWQYQQQQQQGSPWQQQQQPDWLQALILAADSWQAVCDVFDMHESRVSYRHVPLLLAQLSHLTRHAPAVAAAVPVTRDDQAAYREFVRTLLGIAGKHLQQYPAQDLSSLLAHCASLPPNCWPSRSWCIRVQERLRPQIKTLNPKALTHTAWALGTMGLKLRQDFAEPLLAGFRDRLQAVNPRDLALMVHGLARCAYRPSDLWFAVYLDRVQRQLQGFAPGDLAMLLAALVHLRCPLRPQQLRQLAHHFSCCVQKCDHHEAALCTWALGKLGHTFQPPRPAAPAATTTRKATSSSVNSSSSQARQQQHSSSSSDDSSDGSTTGKLRSSKELSPPSQQQQQQEVKEMWHVDGVQQKILWQLRLKLKGKQLTGRQLVMMLHGLTLQGSRPDRGWLQVALGAGFNRLQDLDGRGLANLLHALAVLGARPSAAWQEGFWRALVAQAYQQQQRQQQQPSQKQWQHWLDDGEAPPRWVAKHQRRRQQREGMIAQLQAQFVWKAHRVTHAGKAGDSSAGGTVGGLLDASAVATAAAVAPVDSRATVAATATATAIATASRLTAVSWEQLYAAQQLMEASWPLQQLQRLMEPSVAGGYVGRRQQQQQWQALQQQQQGGAAGADKRWDQRQQQQGTHDNSRRTGVRRGSTRARLFATLQQQQQQQQGVLSTSSKPTAAAAAASNVQIHFTPLSPSLTPVEAMSQHGGKD